MFTELLKVGKDKFLSMRLTNQVTVVLAGGKKLYLYSMEISMT